jgi:4-hydroxyphenylpyruvate dioxygenase-like putative hemolysin
VETAVAWVNHAFALLTDDELSINAAHNKLKHGLAVSARGDVRIEFTTTPPNPDGTIPLSAFGDGKSVPHSALHAPQVGEAAHAAKATGARSLLRCGAPLQVLGNPKGTGLRPVPFVILSG